MKAKLGGSFLALMGLVSLCLGFYLVSKEAMLAATGHSTAGTVTGKYTDTDDDNNTHYYLGYSYSDDNGQAHTARSDVFKSMYDSFVEGAPIRVVYSSSYPAISRIRASGAGLLPGGILAIIGGVTSWFGLRMLLRRIFWENKTARLMTNGERCIGRLVAVEEDKSEALEDYTPLVLVYTFIGKDGQERTGKTFHIKASEHDFWKGRIGCPLEVRVNPADPADHVAIAERMKDEG